MDFDQYGQAFLPIVRRQIQFLRKREAINRIHAIEKLRCSSGFIALEMADQMPRGIQVSELRVLSLELLHAILTELAQPQFIRSADRLCRESLRYGDESNFIRAAPCAFSREHNSLANTRQIRRNRTDLFRHRRDSSMPARTTSHESLAAAKLSVNSMPVRGKFIVLEGIDGSGKRTQIEALAREFGRRGMALSQISFPNYGGFFGKLVAQFLNGEFGPLAAVDPHFSALLYAGDRLESKPTIESALAAGKIVLADRYVASNLAHQGARAPREKRPEFLAWLKQLEYQVHALPVEDLVIYLRLPVAEAHRLVGRKGARDYTKSRRDLQEADITHLEAASQVYDELARQPNWITIECFNAESGALREPAEIHAEITAAVDARTHSAVQVKG